MLVEMMSRMLAISQMHNAQHAIMRNNMKMDSIMHSIPFMSASPQNMEALSRMETQFAIDKEINEMRYMLAQAQLKSTEKSAKDTNRLFISA